MIDIEGSALSAEEHKRLQDPRVGGVILFSRNYEGRDQLHALTTEIHDARTPSLLVAVDQEGGRIQRFRADFTTLPAARRLGHEYEIDPIKARRYAELSGWLMAAELREVGIDLSFAPVVDLDWGLSEVIGDRALHRDPEVVASLALAYMHGMHRAGMAAVAKHFPGHGAVTADSHRELPVDHRLGEDLEPDLRPYRRMIDNGLLAVMVAHVRYPEVDRRIASVSPYWLKTELRRNLGFAGVIFSDDLDMSAMREVGPMPKRVSASLDAGADMVLICNNTDAVAEVLELPEDIGNPASQARLVTLRPHKADWQGQLRDSSAWRDAVRLLAAADARPELHLDG
jgi:beta-N-acetylhexosaminidase